MAAYETSAIVGSALALAGAFFAFMLLIIAAVYVYVALALSTIAKKTKTKDPWLAWIPIANVYLMTRIAKLPGWLIIPYVLTWIPIIGGFFALISIPLSVFFWWKIAEARKMPGWYGLLILIPLVNLIIIGIIAWKDK